MKFQFTIKNDQVNKAYQKALTQALKSTTIKGFRKGKAPRKLVEEKVGAANLRQQAIESLLPQAYRDQIQKKNLKPISYPSINPVSVEKNSDLVFEAEVAERPQVKLGDYKKLVKAAAKNATQPSQIWTPGQKATASQTKPASDNQEDQLLKAIFDALLDKVALTVPPMLVDREVNRSLTKLLDQVNRLGLKVEDYLESLGKTHQQLKNDYQKTATDNLKLEFILQEIADDLKLQVTGDEIDTIIKSVPDEKSRAALDTPSERLNVAMVLLKRKTVEQLKKLAQAS